MPTEVPSGDVRHARGRQRLSEVDGAAGEEIVATLGDLGRYIVDFAFGDIYSRSGLSLRDRELITVAMLGAMGGREPQLDVHIHGALNVGVSIEELHEVMIHIAPYAGFPAAINGMRRLEAVASQE